MSASSSIGVVIVNWNGRSDTAQCLRSLELVRKEWAECIVVDNASADGSPEALRRDFPWITLLDAEQNLGYAAGNNLGIRTALTRGVEAVFVLNNDCTVFPGALRALSEAAAGDRQIGLAGPLVHRGTALKDSWYAGCNLSRRPFLPGENTERAAIDAATPLDRDYVSGCALFVRRHVVETIGLLDERFFLTWEDTDWSARAHGAGLRTVIVPQARVAHRGSQSFDGLFSPLYCYYFFRNMLLFAKLHFSPVERPRAYRDVASFARTVYHRWGRPSTRASMMAAMALGALHFAVGRFGPAPERLTRRRVHNRASSP